MPQYCLLHMAIALHGHNAMLQPPGEAVHDKVMLLCSSNGLVMLLPVAYHQVQCYFTEQMFKLQPADVILTMQQQNSSNTAPLVTLRCSTTTSPDSRLTEAAAAVAAAAAG